MPFDFFDFPTDDHFLNMLIMDSDDDDDYDDEPRSPVTCSCSRSEGLRYRPLGNWETPDFVPLVNIFCVLCGMSWEGRIADLPPGVMDFVTELEERRWHGAMNALGLGGNGVSPWHPFAIFGEWALNAMQLSRRRLRCPYCSRSILFFWRAMRYLYPVRIDYGNYLVFYCDNCKRHCATPDVWASDRILFWIYDPVFNELE